MKDVTRRLIVVGLLAGLTAVSAALAGQEEDEPKGRKRPRVNRQRVETAAEAEVRREAVQFRMEVAQLNLPGEEAGNTKRSTATLDMTALAAEAFQGGDGQVKYSLGGPVALDHEATFRVKHRVPFVRSSTLSKAGIRASSVEYENVGCSLNLMPQRISGSGRDTLWVEFDVAISELLSESSVEMSQGLAAPIFGETHQEFAAVVPVGEDVYFWSVAAVEQIAEHEEGILAYVYRVRFDAASPGE